MNPVERLLNLVALLLESRRPLTFEEIRTTLEAYGQSDRASAKRQFERDKDVLRGLGIPVEMAPTDVWAVDEGYHIPKEQYHLPEIAFTPEEVAALFVAAHGAGDEGDAAQAFQKLALHAPSGLLAALGDVSRPAGEDASAPHLQAVAEAVSGHRRVRFGYRAAQGEEGKREVDAWGLVYRRGSWYLIGNDRDRGEPRAYRLSRMTSEIKEVGEGDPRPDGFEAREHITAGPWGLGEPDTTATVAFSPKVSWWVLAGLPAAKTVETRDDGWIVAEVPAGGETFVSWVLSFGPDAELVAPGELREAVVERLKAIDDSR